MPKPRPTPADRLRAAMFAASIGPTRLAELLGVRQPTIAQYLTGKRRITPDFALRAARVIGCDPRELSAELAEAFPDRG